MLLGITVTVTRKDHCNLLACRPHRRRPISLQTHRPLQNVDCNRPHASIVSSVQVKHRPMQDATRRLCPAVLSLSSPHPAQLTNEPRAETGTMHLVRGLPMSATAPPPTTILHPASASCDRDSERSPHPAANFSLAMRTHLASQNSRPDLFTRALLSALTRPCRLIASYSPWEVRAAAGDVACAPLQRLADDPAVGC
jgi:hypothetical protein